MDSFDLVPRARHILSHLSPHKDEEDETFVSISTSFYPGAHSATTDIVLSSSDFVLFYVNSSVLLDASQYAFGSVICLADHRDSVIHIPESAITLNIILHIIYEISCAQHSPPFDAVIYAVNQLPQYGFDLRLCIPSTSPFHGYLLSFAPLFPLELYALAGHYGLNQLAASTSPHLLSYPLANISDKMAERMGAIYLKRLMCLHVKRLNALKNIVLRPPEPHAPTKKCNFKDQSYLSGAWALVAAYLAWDARPGLYLNQSLVLG